MKLLIGVSSASGVELARTLIDTVRPSSHSVSMIVTDTANQISRDELGFTLESVYRNTLDITYYPNDSFYAPPASGSTFSYDALVVIPASMGFLARCAHGISSTLLERAFDVALKERTKIVVVPREMPFSTIHLETLLKLSQLGVIVCPACPSYYSRPTAVKDLTDNVVGKVLKLVGVENGLYKKWRVNG